MEYEVELYSGRVVFFVRNCEIDVGGFLIKNGCERKKTV